MYNDKKDLMLRVNETQKELIQLLDYEETRKILRTLIHYEILDLKSTVQKIKNSEIKEKYNIKVDDIMKTEIDVLSRLFDLLK